MKADIIIRKQKFRIRTTDEAIALQVRKRMNDTLQYELIAMLESLFQRYSPGNDFTQIDKLTVNIGQITPSDFEKNFLQMLEAKLGKELEEIIPGITSSNHHHEPPAFNHRSSQEENKRDEGPNTSAKERRFRALIYFLENGIYPWWYHKSLARFPGEILDDLEKTEMERLALLLIEVHKKDTVKFNQVIQRVTAHLPLSKKDALVLSILSLKNDEHLTQNVQAIMTNYDLFKSISSISLTEFNVLLAKTMIGHISDSGDTIKTFLKTLLQEKKIIASQIRSLQTKTPALSTKKIVEELSALLDEKNAQPDVRANENPGKPQGKRAIETNDVSEEGIYIENAGLILVHPFLQSLFEECGLLDEQKQFLNETAAIRATVLLYYLQTGEDDYKEWESAFCKILCGLPVDTAIPDNIVLSGFEKNECIELLKVMIEYWSALRSNEINVLRANFFNREGKIVWKEDYWLLQIERTGIDILIDKLPWGLGTIKFPWLRHLIHVEW